MPLDIEFASQQFELHSCGSLYWPAMRVLIASDLHLEKASSYARHGVFLPPYDTSGTLAKLHATYDRTNPETVILLGDVFHDGQALARMHINDLTWLQTLTSNRKVVWIEGNHDGDDVIEGLDVAPSMVHKHYTCEGVTFTHIAGQMTGPEISGHYHPCVTIRHKGHRLRRPCFVANTHKMIIPAFGVLTGGLDIADPAISDVMGSPAQVWALSHDRVLAVPRDKIGLA